MSPYMVPVAVNPSPSPSSSSSSSPPPEYDLYGVVNHFGNVYMGHYTACARPPSDMDKRKFLSFFTFIFSSFLSIFLLLPFLFIVSLEIRIFVGYF